MTCYSRRVLHRQETTPGSPSGPPPTSLVRTAPSAQAEPTTAGAASLQPLGPSSRSSRGLAQGRGWAGGRQAQPMCPLGQRCPFLEAGQAPAGLSLTSTWHRGLPADQGFPSAGPCAQQQPQPQPCCTERKGVGSFSSLTNERRIPQEEHSTRKRPPDTFHGKSRGRTVSLTRPFV